MQYFLIVGFIIVIVWFKMVLMTMIARIHDGLPLAATMQEDEQVC